MQKMHRSRYGWGGWMSPCMGIFLLQHLSVLYLSVWALTWLPAEGGDRACGIQ